VAAWAIAAAPRRVGWAAGWAGPPAPFQAAVANGEIHYYVGGGQGGGPGGSSDSTSAQIAAWVAANYPATTVGGQTVYDLTA